MPRLLVNGDWFDPVSGISFYESDYEAALVAHSGALFPGFHCVQFKALVDSEYGRGKPDLALIDHQYRFWYVVEVELDTHPFQAHVEEQVRKFAYGDYESAHASALARADARLDPQRLEEMMRGEAPRVLVLVTTAKPEWSTGLARYGATVGVVEIFRDDRDHVVLRVNGDQPQALGNELLSQCTGVRLMTRALLMHSPAPFAEHDSLDLLYRGTSTRWKIVRVKDQAYLVPSERLGMPIVGGSRWAIHRVGDDVMLLDEE